MVGIEAGRGGRVHALRAQAGTLDRCNCPNSFLLPRVPWDWSPVSLRNLESCLVLCDTRY